ncbi:laccase-11-like, partial [Homarus americanus]
WREEASPVRYIRGQHGYIVSVQRCGRRHHDCSCARRCNRDSYLRHHRPRTTDARACYDCPRNTTDCHRPECIPGDGFKRRILVVNKQMPGPPIQVCQGDRVVVDVKNLMYSGGLTVHWHGITMEGPRSSRGRFQRGDGVFGPIIVRQPPSRNPYHDCYDHDLPEHVIMFHDWLHIPTEDKFVLRHHGGGDDFPDSMLVNGRGPRQHPNASSISELIPYTRFKVTPGNRYRLRLINPAILNCPIVVSIDEHIFTIIASDGNPIIPVNATSLVVYPGERWDVVISADNSKSGAFWMSFMGGVDCAVTEAHQFALLEYEELGFTQQVNSINSACYNDLICVADLRSPEPLPRDLRKEEANFTFYLAFEMNRIHNPHFYSRMYYDFHSMMEDQQIPTPQINNLSYVAPATPLILGGGKRERVCNAESHPSTKNCQDEYCECLHMYKIPLGSTVEMVLIDEGQFGDENHPIHLHGQSFWVLGQDRPNDVVDASITRDQVIEMDRTGQLHRNFDHPVYKDTVTIPDGGYSIVRFRASNPGYWLLHCHLIFHSVAGMELVFKVGDDDDIPSVPSDFPWCGDYKGDEF